MFLNPLNSRRPVSQRTALANAVSLIEGHHRFLRNNTGDTVDATVQHYVQNNQGVLSNNRHFIAHSQMEYQPNGDGTTEGQALHILGYAHAYLATKDPRYLEAAIWHWEAYEKYFYAGQPIPDTPQRRICNWIINSKEPVLANWPVDPVEPTHSGFKGVPFAFTNGALSIPHGAPHWGEYLDKATFAFDGALAWGAINAGVRALREDGSTDWDKDGTVYEVDWIIAHTGQKITLDGRVLSEGHTGADIGRVQLKDTTLNGTHLFNYATRQPVEHGGYLIPRNAVQHNRPLHVPLLGGINQMGNAADGELWYMDACYLLWRITGEERYKKAMDACLYTAHEYTLIDSTDRFFRQSTVAATPFTDGISYEFAYPSEAKREYGRDSQGYITLQTDVGAQVSIEQQSVWFRVGKDSKVRTSFGGVDQANGALTAKVEVTIAPEKVENTGTRYCYMLPESTSSWQVLQHDIPLSQFYRVAKDDGSEFIMADLRAVVHSADITSQERHVPVIFPGRAGNVVRSFFPGGGNGGWYVIGNYLQPTKKAPLKSITYRADGNFNVRIQDKDGWRWWWMLPATDGAFSTVHIRPQDGTLSGYQPNAAGRPNPSAPNYDELAEMDILLDNDADTNLTFEYYCINELPDLYDGVDGYTMLYRLTLNGQQAFRGLVGDCTVVGYRNDSLAYSPGVIPFSNIYSDGTEQIGAWHGMPYPGYQYPLIFCLDPETYSVELGNMVDFLYDSQQWYQQKFGVLGPGAAAHIWNRWDNYRYGPADTWTQYHWGDGNAWAGYQPRAMMGACRAWYELVHRGKPVPPKLVTYAENWLRWLVQFVKDSKGILPTDFPTNSVPKPVEDDFTGHMTGLWLAGACLAAMAGSQVADLDVLIEACMDELQANYMVTPIPGHAMNGSWTPDPRLGTDNGMFFGFWAGEILRGLGLYIQYRTLGVGANIYGGPVPA